MKVILEKHNNALRGGSWFRTYKGVLLGRGIPSGKFRGEECALTPALSEKYQKDAAFRADIYHGLRRAGNQVIARFEPDAPELPESFKPPISEPCIVPEPGKLPEKRRMQRGRPRKLPAAIAA